VDIVIRRDDERVTAVKGHDGDGWSFDNVMVWLGWRKNGDAVEWYREWSNLRWHFYNSGGWESGCSRRVAGGGGADSMLQFWFERGDDGTKYYQKMK
jgi:hypothetical protein